jgi:hypothetical protein
LLQEGCLLLCVLTPQYALQVQIMSDGVPSFVPPQTQHHLLGQPHLAQPPSLGGFSQPQQMMGTPQIMVQPMTPAPVPEFTFNPATPAPMVSEQQPAGPTFSSILRDVTALADMGMLSADNAAYTTHEPVQKTLSAIVRELVNDETIIPPNTNQGQHQNASSGMQF